MSSSVFSIVQKALTAKITVNASDITTLVEVVETGDLDEFPVGTQYLIMANHSSNSQVVTLPDPSLSNRGQRKLIVKYADNGPVTVTTTSQESVFDGTSELTSIMLTAPFDRVELVSTGLHWITK